MQLKTILNRVEPFKSFVYTQIKMIDDDDRPQIEIAIEPRANGRPICSGCRQPAVTSLGPSLVSFGCTTREAEWRCTRAGSGTRLEEMTN